MRFRSTRIDGRISAILVKHWSNIYRTLVKTFRASNAGRASVASPPDAHGRVSLINYIPRSLINCIRPSTMPPSGSVVGRAWAGFVISRERWSNNGQKRWSNAGQTGFDLARTSTRSAVVKPTRTRVASWSKAWIDGDAGHEEANAGQKLVKNWSHSGQRHRSTSTPAKYTGVVPEYR